MKERFHIFSKDTTFHGFRELAESKSWWQRCLWLIILTSCTIVFAVYASNQVDKYVNGQTSIRIGTLTNDEYVFRSVQILIPKWYFIDRSKLRFYNVTYEEYLAAKSYLHPVWYYFSDVPVEEAKRRLGAKLEKLNISSVVDFLSLLAFDAFDSSNDTLAKTLVADKFVYASDCYYVLNTSTIQLVDFDSASLWFYFNFATYWNNIYDHLASGEFGPDEQNHITEAALKDTYYSPVLLLDGYPIVSLQSGYTYTVNIETRVQRRLVNCTNEYRTSPWYKVSHCFSRCEYEADVSVTNASTCISQRYLPEMKNLARPLCSLGLVVNESEWLGRDPNIFEHLPYIDLLKRADKIAECKKKCLPSCEQWKTTFSTVVSEEYGGASVNNYSTIDMRFPNVDSILVTEEIYQYMWHDLVSDLGGLLGLWLGASMMSLFQMLHLCCRSLKVENQHVHVPLGNVVVINNK